MKIERKANGNILIWGENGKLLNIFPPNLHVFINPRNFEEIIFSFFASNQQETQGFNILPDEISQIITPSGTQTFNGNANDLMLILAEDVIFPRFVLIDLPLV